MRIALSFQGEHSAYNRLLARTGWLLIMCLCVNVNMYLVPSASLILSPQPTMYGCPEVKSIETQRACCFLLPTTSFFLSRLCISHLKTDEKTDNWKLDKISAWLQITMNDFSLFITIFFIWNMPEGGLLKPTGVWMFKYLKKIFFFFKEEQDSRHS